MKTEVARAWATVKHSLATVVGNTAAIQAMWDAAAVVETGLCDAAPGVAAGGVTRATLKRASGSVMRRRASLPRRR